jgi:hypothetical protein
MNPEAIVTDLRGALERSYKTWCTSNQRPNTLSTRIAYYKMAMRTLMRTPFEDKFTQGLMLQLLMELLSDAEALFPLEMLTKFDTEIV